MTKLVCLVALVAGLFALIPEAHAQKNPSCRVDFGNATFDVSSLYNPGSGYTVQDKRNNPGSRNFTYLFNICGVEQLPGFLTSCNTTTGDGGRILYGPSSAYQVDNYANNHCHRLAGSPTDIRWSLYDTTNPARGMVLNYYGGDRCKSGTDDRELRIWLQCSATSAHEYQETVEETQSCLYEVFMRSTYACPVECPTTVINGEPSVCSRHGICGYDSTLGKPRCFCNPGYAGESCAGPPSSSDSGLSAAGAVLIFVCVLLVLVIGALAYVWRRIRSLRLDPVAYSVLRGGPAHDDGIDDSAL